MIYCQVMGWTAGSMLVGALLYPLLQAARAGGWCTFVGPSPHEYKVRRACLLRYGACKEHFAGRWSLQHAAGGVGSNEVSEEGRKGSHKVTSGLLFFHAWEVHNLYGTTNVQGAVESILCCKRLLQGCASACVDSLQHCLFADGCVLTWRTGRVRGGIPASASVTSFAAVHGASACGDDVGGLDGLSLRVVC